jgi:phenylpropionate dioxygenase-like ring-hydroxylating dioxygenase large terminal subunit
MFLEQQWYAAAWSEDVGRSLLARRILGQRVVLYRTAAGAAVALEDRCPHRSAPLSMGRLVDDGLECGYHGIVYDAGGRCVRVPGQERIPPGATVRSYPVAEKHGLVWIWTGEAAAADPAQIIEIPQYGASGWTRSRGYTYFESNYLNICDNLVDPAHTSFVHRNTIGNAAAAEVAITAEEKDGVVFAGRWIDDAPPVPIVQRFLRPKGNVDRWQFYYVRPPCISWVDFGSFDAGLPHSEEQKAGAPFRILSYAMLAPETEASTHYFWFQLRNFAPGDAAVTAEFEKIYAATFDEDRAILNEIQRIETEAPNAGKVRIASDGGVVRYRRAMQRLLEAEQSPKKQARRVG